MDEECGLAPFDCHGPEGARSHLLAMGAGVCLMGHIWRAEEWLDMILRAG